MGTAPSSHGAIELLTPADIPLPWQHAAIPAQRTGTSYAMTAAVGTPGMDSSQPFTDFTTLARLIVEKYDALGRGMLSEPDQMALASSRPEDWANLYARVKRSAIADLHFQRTHDFVLEHQYDWPTVERACNETRLPGGSLTPTPSSLTAAPGTPGWCAPCQVDYDFCPPAVLDGIVDLPTVIVPRGCLTYPSMPDFGVLYSGTGFCYPAADYDKDGPDPDPDPGKPGQFLPGPKNKPCMKVPCPEQQTCTLDPCGVCLESSILIERAYPELIQYFIANALVAWGHRLNCRDLTQMIAASTKVPLYGAASLGPQTGPGAAVTVLEAIEFYSTWLRYKYRLGRTATIEAVLPDWLKGVVRADLSKRRGVALMDVTDEMVAAWLALRKVRVQWVLGLDEAYCDLHGTPPAQIDPKVSKKFGGNVPALGWPGTGTPPVPVPPTMWPKTASFLLYPAGTFFRARTNLVNIEAGMVDSTLLRRNERMLLFLEEATAVCKRCYESLYITVDLCTSGHTGGGSEEHPSCSVPPPPQIPPEITVTAVDADVDKMTVSVVVDNHGNGPVTINWGQTDPALPEGSNSGNGHDVTIQQYTLSGPWTITATDADNPALVGTAQAPVPYSGAPDIALTVDDANPAANPPRYEARAAWDNHGQGPVKLFWREANQEAVFEPKPVEGNATKTYTEASDGARVVRVEDARNPSRFKEQTINLPDFT